jgi:hypothetical protein
MSREQDIYSRFSTITRNISNADLCTIDQIHLLDIRMINRNQSEFIPNIIDLAEKKLKGILCNLDTLKFLSNIKDTMTKKWERRNDSTIWFLGTTLAKPMGGIEVFPILDGYSLRPSFRYITSYMGLNDRLALFY